MRKMRICFSRLMLLAVMLTPQSIFQARATFDSLFPEPPEINLRLGNPSNATASISDKDYFLLTGLQFILSYNNSRGGKCI